MSWRELRVFLRHLPTDSATHRAVNARSPDDEYWTIDRHLAAATVDALREQTFVMLKLHGDPKKVKRLKPPPPIERPGVETPKRDAKVIRFGGRNPSATAELAATFGAANH